MSESILERSLDDIISEEKNNRKQHGRGRPNRNRSGPFKPNGRGHAEGRKPFRQHISSTPNKSIPKDVSAMAGSRPVLRVKNIHHELNGEDLSNLFSQVAPVDFIKFDSYKDTIAYVCFENDNVSNNSKAITKFDGRKAMGKILVVENTISLADRILAPQINPDRPPRERDNRKKKPSKKIRPQKKSVEDLDDELSAYMNSTANTENQEAHSKEAESNSNAEAASAVADDMNID